MTLPREILPGTFWLVSRRCAQGQFLLRPDDETNEIFEYCLAEAASRYSIGLIAWLVMSNHYHGVIYDERGELPAFLAHLHRNTAKALNARWGRRENLWSSEETSLVQLVSLEDIFDKVIYVLTNPIKADLVDTAAHWPGSSSFGHLDAKPKPRARPRFYFAEAGTMPPAATLHVHTPHCVDAEIWNARVREAVARVEEDHRARRRKTGKRLIGRRAVLSASPFETVPSPREPGALRPTVACKDTSLRAKLLEHVRAFRAWYRRARREFFGGDLNAEFPPGTYKMRRMGVRCAPFPNGDLMLAGPA